MRSAAKQVLTVLVLSLALLVAPLAPAVASPTSTPPASDPSLDGQLTDGAVQSPQQTAATPPTGTAAPTAAPTAVAPSPSPQSSETDDAEVPPASTGPSADEDLQQPTTAGPASPTAPSTPPTATAPPVPSATPESRQSSPTTVQCYGSSSIDYLCGGGHLGTYLPGWNVRNYGVGSIGPVAIGTIAGVYQTSLSKTILVPGSGSVNLGDVVGLPMDSRYLGRITFDVEIGGIRGKITHFPDLADASLHWKFTRSGSGSPLWVAAGTRINSLETPLPGSSSVLWIGANGIEDTARVKEVIAKVVEAHTAVGAKAYVIQLPPRWDYSNPLNNNRNQVNAWIRQTYGERAIPLSDYLLNGALTDAGRVPTAADYGSMGVGLMPKSFWMAPDDSTHMNPLGMTTAGRYLSRWVKDAYTYSEAVKRFDVNSTANVRVSGTSVTVSGHAFDLSDMYTTIPVGITVDGKWHATSADRASSNLHAYGIPGAHGYSMTFELSPGDHFICTVGVGFGAGNNSLPPCQTVTVVKQAAPLGQMALADASGRVKVFYGWALAPSTPSRSISVAILIDGSWHHAVSADLPSPGLGVAGKHGFWAAASLSPGRHSACAVAIESASNMTNLGCQEFTIR